LKNYIILKNKNKEELLTILDLYKKHINACVYEKRNELFSQIILNIKEGNTRTSKELLLVNSSELRYQSQRIELMVEDALSREKDADINWGSYLDILAYQSTSYYKESVTAYMVNDSFYLSTDSIDENRLYFFLMFINTDCSRITDKDFQVESFDYEVFEPYNSVYLYLDFDFINVGDIKFNNDDLISKVDKELQILEYIGNTFNV